MSRTTRGDTDWRGNDRYLLVAIVLGFDGWEATVLERINPPDRPIPVYRKVAAFDDREEAWQYAEAKNKELE